MGILNELGPKVVKNQNNLDKLGNKGMNNESLSKAAALAIPAILFGLWQKSKNQEEKAKIENKLDQYNTDAIPGDVDKDLDGYIEKVDRSHGQDMLGDIFGGKKEDVSQDIADKTGVSQAEVDAVLEKLAPTVAAMLAKEKAKGKDIEAVTREEITKVEKDNNFDVNDVLGSVLKKAGANRQEDPDIMGQLGGILGKFL